MAKADIQMPDEFLEKISRLGKEFDSVAERVLEAGGEVVLEKTVRENGQRLNIHKLDNLLCDEVRITVRSTYGHESARVYEVRLY
jgi:phage tail tape-measure protein